MTSRITARDHLAAVAYFSDLSGDPMDLTGATVAAAAGAVPGSVAADVAAEVTILSAVGGAVQVWFPPGALSGASRWRVQVWASVDGGVHTLPELAVEVIANVGGGG
ncbi:hypothetical protein SAMN05444336_112131 [Albimonas donghaensis]|uniref:Uncharacterized protein n=1 Tax=Albimonas donghaensis TaxID=356660 RepID=A0A1H3FID2_9RHOB|nr:hypothetical protein [Albimonas donghaensis]SDX90690.1 hypothetical protein SAMN05444336_112131 [Albimonas donghaensis]